MISFKRSLATTAVFACLFSIATAQTWPSELLITPEKTSYAKTSTYSEVMDFLDVMSKRSPYIKSLSIGKSLEGKSIPVAVLSKPAVTSASEAKASGKLIIYIQGNIHAGEVEGKEVVMMHIREILEKNDPVLDKLIILFAPIYNTDSNDKMAYGRRPSQENSPPEVGIRENSQGLDLNRDGVKMEALETNGLLQFINEWDPQLFVDLHTTNGTWHGYDLTWAPSYHSAGEQGPYDYTVSMLNNITKSVKEKAGLELGPFGDYDLKEGWPVKNFYTYNHHPRYLVNQFGLRNRMAILSEAFAHQKFDRRINSTYEFSRAIIEFAAIHVSEIQEVNKKAEEETIRKVKESASTLKKGVKFKMVPLQELNNFPTYDYEQTQTADGTKEWKRTTRIARYDHVNYYAKFQPEIESTLPAGYVFSGELTDIANNLEKHGIKVSRLSRRTSFTGELFEIERFENNQRKFEGHFMAKATGKFSNATRRFHKGDFYVDLAQPLGNLAFYMLEPQSDDGLLTWNFFDALLEKQKSNNKPMQYPVFKYYNFK